MEDTVHYETLLTSESLAGVQETERKKEKKEEKENKKTGEK